MTRRILAIALFLLIAAPVYATDTIAFDTAVDGGNNGGSTSSLTFNSGSVSATAHRIGIVICLGDTITGGSDNITGITWNGVATALYTKYTTPDRNGNMRFAYIYWLADPASGVTSIVVSSGSTKFLLCGELSYTGVAQTGPAEESTNNADKSVVSITTSLTTSVNNSWTILLSQALGIDRAQTAQSGSTFRATSAAFADWMLCDSNGAITPAGSYSMSVDWGTGSITGVGTNMFSIKPWTASTAAAPRSMLLHVGP